MDKTGTKLNWYFKHDFNVKMCANESWALSELALIQETKNVIFLYETDVQTNIRIRTNGRTDEKGGHSLGPSHR